MSVKNEQDLYEDLYGNEDGEEFAVQDLEDIAEQPIKQETPAETSPKQNKVPAADPPPATGFGALPPKPTVGAVTDSTSYSAQIAKQFSSYQQTPAQERKPREDMNGGPSMSNMNIGTHDERTGNRPVRPSEMKDEGKMFVGGLSWDTTDEGLRAYFSEFGKVDACTIMRDNDGRSRGFAFLTFEEAASVNAVMCREHYLDGKAIDPKRAIPREEHLRNTRYFVGGLAATTTAESMKGFFAPYGKVVDATVMVDRETGRSKGFGFVTFDEATPQTQALIGQPLTLDEKQIEVKAAQPRSQRDQQQVQQGQRSNGAAFDDSNSRTPTVGGGGMGMMNGAGVGAGVGIDPQQMAMMYQRMMSRFGGGNMPGNMGNMGAMGMNMPGAAGMGMNPMMGMGNMGANGMGAMGAMGAMGGMGAMGNMGGGGMSPMGGGMGAMGAMGNMAMMSGMGGMSPIGGGGMGMRPAMPNMAGGMGMGGGMAMGGMGMGMGGGGMGRGMGGGGMRGAMNQGMGRGRGGASMMMATTMAGGTGPARTGNRGQHGFHPYAR